jgi:hypothetical protein
MLMLCATCRNLLFLQSLLGNGVFIEDAWPDSGETPLLLAVRLRDVEVGWPWQLSRLQALTLQATTCMPQCVNTACFKFGAMAGLNM